MGGNRTSGIHRTRVLFLVAALALGAGRPARADEDPLAARWSAARAEAEAGLHVLAEWCTSAKLFKARAEVYEAVLLFDPDDGIARQWLRYRRTSDGGWERKPHYVPPHDRGRGRDDFETRRADWRRGFAAAASALLREAKDAGDERLANEILQLAVQVAPDAEALRLANGEVRLGEGDAARWVLAESETALARRGALREAAQRAIEAVAEPQGGQLAAADRIGDVSWGPVLQGVHVRVMGTPPAEEMGRQLVLCEATWPFFQDVFGIAAPLWNDPTPYGRGITVYVTDSVEAGNAFLAAQPGMTPRDLEFVAPLVGSWLPQRPALLVKAPTPATRFECGPKMLLSAFVRNRLGIDANRAWASEGLAHYLVYPLAGTRVIGSVRDHQGRYAQPRPGAPEYGEHTPLTDDWLRAGLALVRSAEKPNIHLMAGKDVNAITQPEVLYAYCLVSYVLEGRPDVAVGFFQDVGKAERVDLDEVVLRRLGFDTATWEARVQRWLEETTR